MSSSLTQKDSWLDFLAWLRGFVGGVLFLIVTTIGTFVSLIVSFFPGTYILISDIAYLWGDISLRIYGIQLKILSKIPHQELLRADHGSLLLFNHASHMDIPVLMKAFRARFRFGAKIELFSIPVWGSTMRRVGVLPIARDKRSEVMKLYEESIARVKKGENFMLAPEGTRQEQDELGVFKNGPFIFAIKAQMPIIPVVILGARQVLKKGHLLVNSHQWSSTILLEALSPIPTVGYSIEQLEDLKGLVFEKMNESFQRLKTLAGSQNSR